MTLPLFPEASERPSPSASGRDVLDRMRAAGVLTALDAQFARRLTALYEVEDEGVRWAAAVVCHQQANGHVCADLRQLARDGLVAELGDEVRVESVLQTHDDVEAWIETIARSPLVTREGEEIEPRPLVLDVKQRLYLAREFEAEVGLARRLAERGAAPDFQLDPDWTEDVIARLAGDGDPAAASALRVGLTRPLAIVTGGPGTGKTTLVVRLIAALVERALERDEPAPRVRLLAPTGKAAAAMAGAFARGRENVDAPSAVLEALPEQAGTIQRALLGQSRLDRFGRAPDVRLDADVVVVDEASMVDLAMMKRLFDACVDVPRVLLLGDSDQLASVESGAVLHELSTPEGHGGGLDRSRVRLTRSHRFDAEGGIGRLAAAIRDGDVDAVLALLDDPAVPEVSRFDATRPDEVIVRVVAEAEAMHRAVAEVGDPAEKLALLGRHRVLCAHRRGPLGATALGARLDEAAAAVHATTTRAGWWRGRMLLVTRNAPDQDLWNGDIGLIDETTNGLRALFPDGHGGVRSLSAGRLPSHESAVAMSVHKSQGSEFDEVDLVLGDRSSPIMTRELFYTGVTRAREAIRVFASAPAIREMMARRIVRDSGLAERIWSD
ncbi:MAG: exodeoxyribonuclease V subunit alpha [bacterium]|nr:exodeoxyribonuclease V subunit alpha [bacterium]